MSVHHRSYGSIYYRFLDNNSCYKIPKQIQKNTHLISAESQAIYGLVPNKYQYDNSGAICKQLCLLSTKLFLEEDTLSDYAQYFVSSLKKLAKKNYFFLNNLRDMNIKDVMKHVSSSEFIRGDDVSESLMKSALELENAQKISVVLVLGGHSVNVVTWNQGSKITFCYYDPYFGQLFKQSVTKDEIKKVLDGDAQFMHPRSILNKNNILLGQSAIKEDSINDVSLPFILKTIFSNSPSADRSIKFAENVNEKELINYLTQIPRMFDNMLFASDYEAYVRFLDQYKMKIFDATKQVLGCVNPIIKCNSYLADMLVPAFKETREIMKEIITSYEGSLEGRHGVLQIYNKEEICIKEIRSCAGKSIIEKNFFKIMLDDKLALNDGMLQCFEQKQAKLKKAIAEEICSDFSEIDPNIFKKSHQAYYRHIDAKQLAEDECLSADDFDQWLLPVGDIEILHTEL